MHKKYKTFVVINPKSANGYTGKKISNLLRKLNKLGDYKYQLTERKNHACEITCSAIKNGYDRIIAIGGDGTFNEVVNGFFDESKLINKEAVLGFISAGTGADFIRTLNIPSDLDKSIEKIIENKIKKIDLSLMN